MDSYYDYFTGFTGRIRSFSSCKARVLMMVSAYLIPFYSEWAEDVRRSSVCLEVTGCRETA
ncbi:hypothetical protein GGE12_001417, partial [Rhizobium mongolense]|nr:hypothetical protein [Rhizobium mongolense]